MALVEGIVDRTADGSDAGAGWELAGLVIKPQNRASAQLVTTVFVFFIFCFFDDNFHLRREWFDRLDSEKAL